MKKTQTFDVTDLPEHQLKKSSTWKRYHDECGQCTSCQEMSEILDPCCGEAVLFEGDLLHADTLWNQIEAELIQQAQEQYEANDKREDDLL